MNIQKLIPYESIESENFLVDTSLEITKEEFENIQYQDGKITFSFVGCKFKNLQIVNPELIEFYDISIQFIGCVIENIDANIISSDNISLLFNSTILSGTIQNSKLKSVLFNNCIIKNNIFLFHQNKIDISYTAEDIFPKRWRLLLTSCNINNLDLLKTKQSYHIFSSKIITFLTSEVENEKRGIYRKEYQNINEDKVGYYLNNTQKKLLNINLSITYSQDDGSIETKIINSSLNSLSISGYSNAKISIENTKIENWFIRNFSTQKDSDFYNISPLKIDNSESKIEIHKSKLDNVWFDNIDFSEYNTVSFYRTKFGKTIFTSCNFPTDNTSFDKFETLENVHYPDKKSDNYYKNQYEIFLQLKIVLESTGNFYEAQKLQAISNDALKKINQISNWDKSILWINGKSNNHGLSIKQPLIYFFLFSILLYTVYLFSLGRIFNHNEIDYSLFGYYFSFIDITHRSNFLVSKEEFNFSSLSVDFINKIISGFFIYQFISAFRKYGKK